MLNVFIKISQTQVWRQLYACISINYVKMVLAIAIEFAAYEIIKDCFQVSSYEKKVWDMLRYLWSSLLELQDYARYMSPIYYLNLDVFVDAT